jgi:hypothetical protein
VKVDVVARTGEELYRLLVVMPEGNRSLGRPRRKWMNNIKTCLGGTERNGVDWTDVSQDRDK